MRVTDLIQIAETYLRLGAAAAALMIGIFCIGYFAVYKKLLHGTATFPFKKLAAAAVLLCYFIIVLGATMLDRAGMWENGRIDLRPFIAYRKAWTDFSIREWRNIILNIFMFVPFGLLLPLYSRHWQRPVHTYLAGLAFTLCIELAQLIFKRGIFEPDDIFNNLLGTMIGFGIYRLLHFWHSRRSSRPASLSRMLVCQLPLVFTAALFGTIFTIYHFKEYGNLPIQYISRADLSSADIQLHTNLSEQEAAAPVYQMPIADESKTHDIAQSLFEKLGTQIDETENDIYDETAIYWSIGRNYNIWIDFAGCTVNFTDFTQLIDNEDITGESGCSRDEIQSSLSQLGIQIPEGSFFEDTKEGSYVFTVEDAVQDSFCKGTLTCRFNSNHKISSFDNKIITYQKYKDCRIRSEQDAYDQLKKGNFRADNSDGDIISIVIDRVRLDYVADSKGFYQPVYSFDGSVNDEEASIQIPAVM